MNCMVGYVSHWTQLFSISCGSVYLLRFITFWFLSLTIEWAITTASLSKRVLHLLPIFTHVSVPLFPFPSLPSLPLYISLFFSIFFTYSPTASYGPVCSSSLIPSFFSPVSLSQSNPLPVFLLLQSGSLAHLMLISANHQKSPRVQNDHIET